ncbi:MAG: hypothetical protein M0R03_11465 [Novosphingobium sp.]|nr:hypothetical protein [Novosphingobium sp.]
MNKTADLYNNILYTVVPVDMALEFGIYPSDQKFHKSYVLLWDTFLDLNTFDDDKWKKLKVEIPEEDKHNHNLVRILANAYGVNFIPNSWKLEEQKINPLYNE